MGKSPRQHSTRLFLDALVIALLFLTKGWSFAVTANAQTPSKTTTNEREPGIELYRQGKFSEASKHLRKAVDKNKTDAEGWHYLGLALLKEGKLKDASKALETAVKLRPDYPPNHMALAYIFLSDNKLPEAIREAQAAINIDPSIRDAHYYLGVAHLRGGSWDEALKQAEIAVRLDPQFAGGYLLKSQALVPFLGDALRRTDESWPVRRERYSEAAAALERYLQLTPDAKAKENWIEQLESLRFYSASHDGEDNNRVYSKKEVTAQAQVLSKPKPKYTERARFNQITGTVILTAVFAADGNVKYILVLSGLPHGLTEAAVRAAKQIRFTLATLDGRPVSMFIQLEYNFNLY